MAGIEIGAHVRHRLRPGWGIGQVTGVRRDAGQSEFVVAFEQAGEKKLRVSEDAFELVARAEVEAAQQAKQAALRAGRPRSAKVTTLAPLAVVACGWGQLEQTPDGLIAVGLDRALRLFDATGAAVGEIATSAPPSDELTASGDLLVGRRTHDWDDLVLGDRSTGTARSWRSPIQLGIPRVAADGRGRIVVWDRATLQLVDASGATRSIAFAVDSGAHIAAVCFWNDALLVSTAGPRSREPYFRFDCVGLDGAVRWRRAGRAPTPIGDDLLVTVDQGATVVCADGRTIAQIAGVRPHGGTSTEDTDRPFVTLDDDLVFSSSDRVVRVRPRAGSVVWSTTIAGSPALEPPVVVGSTVAVTTSVYGDGKTVWLLDAHTGQLRLTDDATTKVSHLCAVGDDAVVASSFSKKLIGWRHLAGSPERLALPHPDKVFDVRSPEPGSLVAHTGDHLVFWRL